MSSLFSIQKNPVPPLTLLTLSVIPLTLIACPVALVISLLVSQISRHSREPTFLHSSGCVQGKSCAQAYSCLTDSLSCSSPGGWEIGWLGGYMDSWMDMLFPTSSWGTQECGFSVLLSRAHHSHVCECGSCLWSGSESGGAIAGNVMAVFPTAGCCQSLSNKAVSRALFQMTRCATVWAAGWNIKWHCVSEACRAAWLTAAVETF